MRTVYILFQSQQYGDGFNEDSYEPRIVFADEVTAQVEQKMIDPDLRETYIMEVEYRDD